MEALSLPLCLDGPKYTRAKDDLTPNGVFVFLDLMLNALWLNRVR